MPNMYSITWQPALFTSQPQPTFSQHFTGITMHSQLCGYMRNSRGRKNSSSTVKQMSCLNSPSFQPCCRFGYYCCSTYGPWHNQTTNGMRCHRITWTHTSSSSQGASVLLLPLAFNQITGGHQFNPFSCSKLLNDLLMSEATMFLQLLPQL